MTKTIAAILGLLRALPHLLLYALVRPVLGPQRAFIAASERIGAIPGFLGIYARQAFYRRTLQGVGRDVYFGYMSLFSKPQAVVGQRVYIGRFCTIGWAELGDDVMLADGVQVLSGGRQHGGGAEEKSEERPPEGAKSEAEERGAGVLRDSAQVFTKVTIGRGAWLGAGAIVMADVGEHAIVGAGAVVTKPVPAGARVGGVPAREL